MLFYFLTGKLLPSPLHQPNSPYNLSAADFHFRSNLRPFDIHTKFQF